MAGQNFGSRLSIAFDNVILYQQLQDANTQLEDRVAQRTERDAGQSPKFLDGDRVPGEIYLQIYYSALRTTELTVPRVAR